MSVLALADAVGEGSVGLVPVDGHVTGRVVDEVVHIIPQLTGASSSSYKNEFKKCQIFILLHSMRMSLQGSLYCKHPQKILIH